MGTKLKILSLLKELSKRTDLEGNTLFLMIADELNNLDEQNESRTNQTKS